MSQARNRCSIATIALVSLFFSVHAHAVKPANVAVLVAGAGQQAQNTIDMLYRQTWVLLDGEYDVRFSTPRMTQVNALYQDDDVDLVITLGSAPAKAIEERARLEKPTIAINSQMPVTAARDNLIVMDDEAGNRKAKEVFIKQVVVKLREQLRSR